MSGGDLDFSNLPPKIIRRKNLFESKLSGFEVGYFLVYCRHFFTLKSHWWLHTCLLIFKLTQKCFPNGLKAPTKSLCAEPFVVKPYDFWVLRRNQEQKKLKYLKSPTRICELFVPGSKLPLFPYNRGWSSTQ